MPRSSKRIFTLADRLAARLKIAEIENAELKRHANFSAQKIGFALRALRKMHTPLSRRTIANIQSLP